MWATPAPTCSVTAELEQLTHDHTLVQDLVDVGRITAEQAKTHPQRSLLTRALDGRDGVHPGCFRAAGPTRRPVRAVHGRAVERGQRRNHRRRAAIARPAGSGRSARRAGAARRRPGQRHRRRRGRRGRDRPLAGQPPGGGRGRRKPGGRHRRADVAHSAVAGHDARPPRPEAELECRGVAPDRAGQLPPPGPPSPASPSAPGPRPDPHDRPYRRTRPAAPPAT